MSHTFQLSDFTIVTQLGSGAFGTTYLARCKLDEKSVCIKVIPLLGGSSRSRLSRAVAFLSRFRHPNVIEYYASFIEGDHVYIVMEYAACGSLRDLIRVCSFLFEGVSIFTVLRSIKVIVHSSLNPKFLSSYIRFSLA